MQEKGSCKINNIKFLSLFTETYLLSSEVIFLSMMLWLNNAPHIGHKIEINFKNVLHYILPSHLGNN